MLTVVAGAHPARGATRVLSVTTRPSSRAARGSSPVKRPLVFAHRGASGYRPEHTIAAYRLAAAMGADYIEPDLVMTKDGALVVRHEPELSGTTDVGSRPAFGARETIRHIDGLTVRGWFAEDFTLAELRSLRAIERLAHLRHWNTAYDGKYQVATFEETLILRAELARQHRRPIGIVPEIKNSTYHRARGFDPEGEVVRLLRKYGLDRPEAPVWVQSFEVTNLRRLRDIHGYEGKSVLLAVAGHAPYDLVAAGDSRTYADLLQRSSLRQLARWVDGIGPHKDLVIAHRIDGSLGSPTPLVEDAHAAGLKVIPWTLRAENHFLPRSHRVGVEPAGYGRSVDEILAFFEAGVDALFCDQPDFAVAARDRYLGGFATSMAPRRRPGRALGADSPRDPRGGPPGP